MDSIYRIGVAIASLATVVVVAGAFVAQGYAAGQQAAAQAKAQSGLIAGGASNLAPLTIYVSPAATPPTIQVAQTSPPAQGPQVIHVIVPSAGGDDGGTDH